jgi:transposase-like protein
VVFLNINGVKRYLWRAVDQNGIVIDILVPPRRDRFAAMRFFRKLLRSTGRRPRVIVTDKLRSYAAAKRIVMPGVAHRRHRYLNNRAENSHQPTREREKRMRRFKSARHAQRLSRCTESSAHTSDPDAICFRPRLTEEFAQADFAAGMKSPGHLPSGDSRFAAVGPHPRTVLIAIDCRCPSS